MPITRQLIVIALATLLSFCSSAVVAAEPENANPAPRESTAEQRLSQAAAEDRYSFVLFYKTNDAATQAMHRTLKQVLSQSHPESVIVGVSLTDAAEARLVKQFGVMRAPMPLTLALAPNGAITGSFPQKVAAADVQQAFVTRAMADAMKSLQERKLVFICVSQSQTARLPAAIAEFQADPRYQKRLTMISVLATDASERPLLEQLKISPESVRGVTTALLAPPAVLVGRFEASASKQQIAAALVEASKCCDDPNCKHHLPKTGQ